MVQVGAATEVELKEKKHRIEDALQQLEQLSKKGLLPVAEQRFFVQEPQLTKQQESSKATKLLEPEWFQQP